MSEQPTVVYGQSVPGEMEAPHVHAPRGELVAERADLPVPGRQRVQWRVAALVLALGGCRARTASAEALHTLTWALEDMSNMATLYSIWTGDARGQILRSWNPMLDSTVRLATEAGLVSMTPTGRQKLTEGGERLLRALRASEGVMAAEMTSLAALGLVSEAEMNRRLGQASRRVEGSAR